MGHIQQNEHLAVELFQCDSFVLCQRVLLVHHAHHFSVIQAAVFQNTVRRQVVPAVKHDVRYTFVKGAGPLRPGARIVEDMHLRAALLVLLVDLRQFLDLHTAAVAYMQLFTEQGLRVLRTLHSKGEPVQHVHGVVVKGLTGAGQGHHMAGAVKQAHAQLVFQCMDLAGDSGL